MSESIKSTSALFFFSKSEIFTKQKTKNNHKIIILKWRGSKIVLNVFIYRKKSLHKMAISLKYVFF